ncbi:MULTISPECIES: OmpA family protein [unclassified Flavobacterium]|uniref:OmpA family protein n=1 Tax=unclassified Flavobacterium TaxID=196869 RepID=UPI001F12966D|nr:MULTISPECIES: OmpA family protein [unclassified Flavobacterium]UMY64864.1 OmpA family protein [Flavobacterium sp. HJ-32-4]
MKSILFFLVGVFASVATAQQSVTVYFDTGKFELSATERGRFEEWIKANTGSKVVAINGYTDEVGSTGYNDTLAQRRVSHVFGLLKGKIDTRDDFATRSFGESVQLSGGKAKNRRVVVTYLRPEERARENEILGIKAPEPVVEARPKPKYPEKIVLTNPDGTKSEFELDRAFMGKINDGKPGEKLKVENLNFQLNTFAITNESRGKLYELLLVMQQNPQLKIDIQGHLCCMPVDRVDLSTKRAKAVREFLVANGIDKSRLSYRGFGSSQPLYPLPERDEAERAANRRVEIEIVANGAP